MQAVSAKSQLGRIFARLCLGWLAVYGLAACGAVPQPFAPEARSDALKTSLLPPQGSGLWMGGFKGLPEAQAVQVAGTLLATLHAEGIPASAERRNEASLLLDGEAAIEETPDGLRRVDLHWTLRAAGGGPIGEVRVGKALPAEIWERDPRPLEELAVAAARKLAKLVRQEKSSQPPRPALAIWPVDGVSADGQRALARALYQALAEAGVPLAAKDQEPGLILLGDIRLGPEAQGQQPIALRWSLIHPNGETIGTFTQANAIPAGEMNAAWGSLAPAIAAGATEGVVALIQAMGRAAASNTP